MDIILNGLIVAQVVVLIITQIIFQFKLYSFYLLFNILFNLAQIYMFIHLTMIVSATFATPIFSHLFFTFLFFSHRSHLTINFRFVSNLLQLPFFPPFLFFFSALHFLLFLFWGHFYNLHYFFEELLVM